MYFCITKLKKYYDINSNNMVNININIFYL